MNRDRSYSFKPRFGPSLVFIQSTKNLLNKIFPSSSKCKVVFNIMLLVVVVVYFISRNSINARLPKQLSLSTRHLLLLRWRKYIPFYLLCVDKALGLVRNVVNEGLTAIPAPLGDGYDDIITYVLKYNLCIIRWKDSRY